MDNQFWTIPATKERNFSAAFLNRYAGWTLPLLVSTVSWGTMHPAIASIPGSIPGSVPGSASTTQAAAGSNRLIAARSPISNSLFDASLFATEIKPTSLTPLNAQESEQLQTVPTPAPEIQTQDQTQDQTQGTEAVLENQTQDQPAEFAQPTLNSPAPEAQPVPASGASPQSVPQVAPQITPQVAPSEQAAPVPQVAPSEQAAPVAEEALSLVLSLSQRRVTLYRGKEKVASYPVAIGREGWETPVGKFEVFDMIEDPLWEHPWNGSIVMPGPNNPLGDRWIGFWTDGTNYIGFHGTPNEESIGQAASHGCVRMRNQDVRALFAQIKLGTPVTVER